VSIAGLGFGVNADAVLPELFERTCGPVAGPAGPMASVRALGTARGVFLRSWRLLGIDGFEVDVPDTPANATEFGYAGSGDNRSAFPNDRVVAVAECGTHAFVAAALGAYTVGEKTLAQGLYPRLAEDELLTAGRGRTVVAGPHPTGAARGSGPGRWHLPVGGDGLPHPRNPPRGDPHRRPHRYGPGRGARGARRVRAAAGPPGPGRRVHRARPGRTGNGTGEVITLLPTITDPAEARADELAAAYHQRWGATRSRAYRVDTQIGGRSCRMRSS